jgi:hypothetical protein
VPTFRAGVTDGENNWVKATCTRIVDPVGLHFCLHGPFAFSLQYLLPFISGGAETSSNGFTQNPL